jgi:transposase
MTFRRFEMHHYRQVLTHMRSGESDRSIARTGIMGRAKVSELRHLAVKHNWLNPDLLLPDDVDLARHLQIRKDDNLQPSLVEPYREEVLNWWQDGIQGTTIHAALIRKYNFQGSYSSIRRFLAQFKTDHPEVTTILDFDPGDAAQVDFGKGPNIIDVYTGEILSTWFFVITLAYSRHQYAEIVTNQKVGTWLGCHRRAFEFFGGVPKRVIIDNPKCAIVKACFHDPAVQKSYAEYAEAYGFLISPCPVRDPKKKGRVESGVKYLKRNFMPLREFRSLSDANNQLKQWILEEAGNRLHGTTRQRPLSMFADTEHHLLHPLPDRPPEAAQWAQVKLHGDCHVRFLNCLYSAPFRLAGKTLWLKATSEIVRIFHDYELVACHPRKTRPGERSTVDDHLPPNALAYKMRDPQWCLKQARAVGPYCTRLIETLFADKVLDNLRAAQGIIRLGDKYGHQRLEDASRRALFFDNPRYGSVKAILRKGLDQLPEQPSLFGSLADVYTGQARFGRDIRLLNTN